MSSFYAPLLDHLGIACFAAANDMVEAEKLRDHPRGSHVAQMAMLLALGGRLLEQAKMPIADVPTDLDGKLSLGDT